MRHNYRRWFLSLAGILAGLVGFLAAAEFDPIEVDEAIAGPKARAKKLALTNTLKEVLQGSKQVSDPPVKADCDLFLQKFVFPMAVQPDRIRDAAKSPRTYLLDMFSPIQATDAGGRKYLLDTTIAEMTKYARGNYAPQARVQAYLILGDLNSRERDANKGTPPFPAAAVLKILLDDFDKAGQPDGILSAILVGLVRHAHLNANDVTRANDEKITAADLDRLEKIALALIAAKNPPAGRSTEGHDWLRRRAAELAGHVAAARPSPAIVNAVTALLADRKDSAEVRLAAASSLSQIARKSGGAGPKLTLKPLSHGIALALVDTLNQSFDQIDKNREKVMTRRKVESLMKSRSATGIEGKYDESDPFADHTDVVQRWVGGKITSAWTGLVGVPEVTKKVKDAPQFGLYTGTPAPADKADLDEVKTKIYDLWNITKDVKIEDPMQDEVKKIRKAVEDLEAVAGGPAPAAGKAADKPADAPPDDDAGKSTPSS